MDAGRLQDTLARLEARGGKHQQERRADVAHVQQHHPELAVFLTEMTQAFGKGRVDYRVALKSQTLVSKR